MYSKVILAAALVSALVLPAAAATVKKPAAKAYYAEQSLKSKLCYAVSFKPNAKVATQIGTDSYPSLSKAIAAIKADSSCKPAKVAMKMKMTAPKPKG